MRMVFLCGHCQGKLAADSSHAGTPVKCPRCQAVVEVPAPEDPGYEFVVEPEPEPPPRRSQDREPEPKRRSSRRLVVRDDRPIRRGKPGMGNGAKAGLLVLLGVVVVGIVVTASILIFSGSKLDPKKAALAKGGGVVDLFGGDPGGVPDGWGTHEDARFSFLKPLQAIGPIGPPPQIDNRFAAARLGSTAWRTLQPADWAVTWGHFPLPWTETGLPKGESAAMLHHLLDDFRAADVRVTEVSGRTAADFSKTQGETTAHYRLVIAGDVGIVVAVGGPGLAASDRRVRLVRESLRIV